MSEQADGSIQTDVTSPGLPLVISFAGLGDEFEFRRTLSGLPVNAVYLRDLKHNWYLNGIPGIGTTVSDVAAFLKNKISELKPVKTIAIGASAGGFSALLYGSLIEVDQILAFSPQTYMDKFHRTIFYDYRWKDRVQQIYNGDRQNRAYLNVKPFVESFSGKVILFYDPKHRLDRSHGKRIRGADVVHNTNTSGGHNLVKELRDSGKLAGLIKSAAAEPQPF